MPPVGPWTDLLASARGRRSRDALFFKPACLIAVIDLIDAGELDPTSMDADRIVTRVDEIVRGVPRGRPDVRWRPVWHLSNDGAWVFSKGGRRIGPANFEPTRKPNSLREWRESFDQLAVPSEMVEHWRSPSERAVLRRAALRMLQDGDSACTALALDLADGVITPTAHDQSSPEGQGFTSDVAARRAVKARAMALARSWLENDGWAVEDRSAYESYDLLASREGERLFVEVKGTTGGGQTIQLTHSEVEFALLMGA